MKMLNLFIVSDSIGETGELMAKAAISQFRPGLQLTKLKRFTHIDSVDQLKEITELAKEQDAIILYTLVQTAMRDSLLEYCHQYNLKSVDLIGPVIHLLAESLGEKAFEEPGLVRKLDEDYFKKIEAIEFAVKYDDGRDPRGLLQADIVLVGVSRTSKTPLSQYLAHKRYKVANVPLVPEVEPPEELFQVDPAKCFGLVITPDKLNTIRKERLIAIGLNDDASYAKIERINEEIIHFEKIVRKIGCRVIDVTNRAVEETANVVINHVQQK
ncbi:pyruvate, water dikinase regulatory protein [Psychrobacillus sp.]|uniref:pyruvate, water dikinase regulatory protein n=1 Tax=Psychrobacillus sp. TaxID=1871623 RepID=UPI0028BE830D|nr:pyruvate, water dikinase regulatory protein [Psychrobacillus sp.]